VWEGEGQLHGVENSRGSRSRGDALDTRDRGEALQAVRGNGAGAMSTLADEEEDCGATPHPLLTVKEAAEYLRTTPAAIYARIYRDRERGVVTLHGVVRVGRSTRIRRADLLKSLRLEGRESLNGGVR
jgi:hypothetical protein